MLASLSVRDFVIVERLDLDFGAGMTVLTGETGAGKSILVDALSVALGERASSDFIRAGRERAEVSAVFDVAPDSAAATWLREHEVDDEGTCIVRRSWSRDGRSRAFINGRPAAVGDLRELAEQLVDIHGQHAHQQLMSRDAHRRLLDDYAENDDLLAQTAVLHHRLRTLREELGRVRGTAGEDDSARLELARYQLQELEQLAPVEGEFESLHAEHQRLARGSELVEACAVAIQTLDGDEPSARGLLAATRRTLAPFADLSPTLAGVLETLETAAVGIDEASADLASFAADLEPDPARLRTVEQRLDRMHELARKHHRPVAGLPALAAELRVRVDTLLGDNARIETLQAEIEQTESRYRQLCETLAKRRRSAGKRLARALGEGLAQLGMSGARFEVRVTSDPARSAAHGHDRVEFLVATNPGQEPLLLSKIASGGELSRIGLVLETVSRSGSGVPTLIFDEVDAGIGGAVAEVVGRLMHTLSSRCQVLCVTHLPQVASLADHHLHVSKQTGRDSASALLEAVSGERRVEEIARMLSGSRITPRTLAHARELLEAG